MKSACAWPTRRTGRITLHMVKDRALADPGNQHWITHYCRQYPGIKLILAHCARGFNAFHTVSGIECLRGLDNVWCDVSAVTEAPAMEAILDVLGPSRLLWGSDYPISHMRGRCVAMGDQFVWFYEDSVDWRRSARTRRFSLISSATNRCGR